MLNDMKGCKAARSKLGLTNVTLQECDFRVSAQTVRVSYFGSYDLYGANPIYILIEKGICQHPRESGFAQIFPAYDENNLRF